MNKKDVFYTYIKYYKPAGFITSLKDEKGRKTIYDILPPEVKNLKTGFVWSSEKEQYDEIFGETTITRGNIFELQYTNLSGTEEHYSSADMSIEPGQFKITDIDGEICLSLKKIDNPSYPQLSDNFNAWYEQACKLREGQISKEEYDEWRYHYSMKDSSGMTASVDSDR